MAVCLVGIILVFCLKLHKIFVYRLAMYQVISALFFGLTRCLQLISLKDLDETGDMGACKTVAYLVVCSSWIKLVLTMWVTVHLFVFTVFLKNLKRLEPCYVGSAVVLGPVIAAIPLITNSYGHAGPWCWIEGHKNQCHLSKRFATGEIQQLSVWYGPAFIVLLINSLLVITTVIVSIVRLNFKVWSEERQPLTISLSLNSQNAINRQKQALYLLLPLLAYPIIFCILITIPLFNRVYEIIETRPNYVLFMASAVSIPSMALAAGIALVAHIAFMKRQVLIKFSINRFAPSIQTTEQDNGRHRILTGSTTVITEYIVAKESDFDDDE